ncbi:MAG: P-loop NTPase [Chitinivibrionales bacterium]|nr:P-loop NTPase [Chitinivibrionales bacterium]MBD3358488.1 P-loop NTPase [Chitinivibrionales bacterium]
MSHRPVDKEQLKEALSRVDRKLVVLSGKGGVGKSTVAVNLAVGLALKGKNTGLLDTDLHGPSVPKMLGLEGFVMSGDGKHLNPALKYDGRLRVMSIQFMLRNADDSIIWRGPLKHSVISQFIGLTVWGDLDYLIIDSPPGTGDEPLSVAQTAKPDGAVIVTTPQEVATADVRKSMDFCRKIDLPIIGIIENMSGFRCPHCGETTDIFGAGGARRMADDLGVPLLGSIPIDPRFVSLSDKGEVLMHPEQAGESYSAMVRIIDKIL